MTTPNQPWPDPSESVSRLIRELAETLLARLDEVIADATAASIAEPQYRTIADDPTLADADARLVVSLVKHWVTSNITEPGKRVRPLGGAEMRTFARDVVLRGLVADDVGAWRSVQRVCWKWWLTACFDATDDPAELRELCEVSGNTLTTFTDDAMAELSEYVRRISDELAGGSQLQRYATVELLLQGADISTAHAEEQLGYALTGSHLGVVVWVDSEDDVGSLDRAAEQVMRACGVDRRLTVVAGTATMWLWIPTAATPSPDAVIDRLRGHRHVRVALGRPARSAAGFRRTHMDAAAAQRLLVRLDSQMTVVRYEDVHLVDLISGDVAAADRFVADVLGDFLDASPVLHRTVLVHVEEGLNRTSTAERLYTHRNTIDRRLARVDELLPTPFAQNPTEVVVALTLLRVRRGGE
ncbi:PucR family transcriptional regulator [Gordonia terrae]